jgi:hypothetical protein
MERKLAAILSADVKGYSLLMGEDEEATIRTLTAYRKVMTMLIEQHRGRVVDYNQRLLPHLGLAASYSELGREEEARAEIAEVLKLNPQFSLAGIRQRWPYKEPADLERLLTALGKAGLQ